MKVVLAYSGGLDTSVMVKWLIENYHCDVIAFIADLGQEEDVAAIRLKAIKTGAVTASVADLKEEFVRDYLFPMLRANAVYEGGYLLGTSIARPLIAKKQIEVAIQEGADAVAHGATGKGNDQVRFELTYYALKPDIRVIAPWREWKFKSRSDLIAYAQQQGVAVPVTKAKPYSSDRNLFHVSFEGGILEDPWQEPPDIFVMTCDPEKAPQQPTRLEIDYQEGNPVAINGKRLSPATLLAQLNKIAGDNGIGRLDFIENRYVGMKSRGVYETPGGTVLHTAHRAIEGLTLDREVLQLRDSLIPRYASLVYNGYWFSPEREVLQKLVDEVQAPVTGTVRLKFYKGNCWVVGRKAPQSLYRKDYVTFEEDKVYHQKDAEGFIKLNALRLKIRKLAKS